MPALDHLTNMIRDLETRIVKAENYKNQPDPGFFECIAGPWLSGHLMPRIDRESSCKFLRAYRENRRDFLTQVAYPLFGKIDSIRDLNTPNLTIAKPGSLIDRMQVVAGRSRLKPTKFQHRLLRGVELRLATLAAMAYIQQDNQVFQILAENYRAYFGTSPWNKTVAFANATPEAFQSAGFHAIDRQDMPLARCIKTAVRTMGGSFLDPAVAFVVDTIREANDFQEIERPFRSEDLSDGAHWLVGDTWVLVVQSKRWPNPDRGMIMRLRVEPVEFHSSSSPTSTVGAFYPHLHLGACMQLAPSFQEGIRNAWLANQSVSHHTDYRWSLIPWDDSTAETTKLEDWCKAYPKIVQEEKDWREYSNERDRYHCLWACLSGPSATLSYAISLRSCMRGIHLRRDLAPSSAFEIPEQDCNRLTSNPSLLAISGIPAKKEVLERTKVQKLLVATRQHTLLPLHAGKWVKKINLEDAFQAATQIESILEDLAIESGAQWSTIAHCEAEQTRQNAKLWRLQNEHRFDNYVAPEYAWQDPNPDYKHGVSHQELPWKSVPIEGDRKDHLANGVRWAIENQKNIVLVDGAGAGKTVSSFKIQELLSAPKTRSNVFGDERPRVVLRWEKSNLPETHVANPTLKELLLEDRILKNAVANRQNELRDLVDYLLDSSRLFLIVDAYDELDERQREALRTVFKSEDSAKALWVITGRDYAIDRETGPQKLFSPLFRRLRIAPFSSKLQDEYMDRALSKISLKKELLKELGTEGWRGCLVGFGGARADWLEMLNLPHHLKTLAQFYEIWKPGRELPRFESPSDLFLQTSQAMLEREMEDQHRLLNGSEEYNQRDACNYLERALGAIALEMACRYWWKEVPGREDELNRNIKLVLAESRERFLRGWRQDSEFDDGKSCWNWSVRILNQFEFLNGATGADINDRVISFTTRRIQEMRAALYLTKYATAEDLENTTDPKSCAKGHTGDREWENLWLGAIRMPKRHQQVHMDRYRRAMEILFERPLRSDQQRRPTELMWKVSRWVDRDLDGRLRDHLGKQFAEILRGTDKRSEVARDLIDLKNFVILADPDKPIDKFDTGRFKMGDRKKVPVDLSKFGLCKYTLSNEQYWLFDDNYLATEQTWLFDSDFRSEFAPSASDAPEDILKAWYGRLEDFKGPHQPAVFVSWYDSYWYSEFLSRGIANTELSAAGWRVQLPTEAQWEYGARAGGKGDYFRVSGLLREPEAKEKTLASYAHFGQVFDRGRTLAVRGHGKLPNAWGLEMIFGNVWQWVYDVYEGDVTGGVDPVRHEPLRNEGSYRVHRGGSWDLRAADCESARRDGPPPSHRCINSGLRLALSSSGIPRLDEQS